MNKNIAFWVMIGGALLSGYDLMTTPAGGTAGDLYGVGKPLEKARWNVYTTKEAPIKNYYISASDIAALTGAFFYFR